MNRTAYEFDETLPELDECADEDRHREEAASSLNEEGKIGGGDEK